MHATGPMASRAENEDGAWSSDADGLRAVPRRRASVRDLPGVATRLSDDAVVAGSGRKVGRLSEVRPTAWPTTSVNHGCGNGFAAESLLPPSAITHRSCHVLEEC